MIYDLRDDKYANDGYQNSLGRTVLTMILILTETARRRSEGDANSAPCR